MPSMIAASFSAIMIVGALVLVEVTAGLTEASISERPRARSPQLVVDEALWVRARHAGAADVIVTVPDLAFRQNGWMGPSICRMSRRMRRGPESGCASGTEAVR
jgi:hypothetical protein